MKQEEKENGFGVARRVGEVDKDSCDEGKRRLRAPALKMEPVKAREEAAKLRRRFLYSFV